MKRQGNELKYEEEWVKRTFLKIFYAKSSRFTLLTVQKP